VGAGALSQRGDRLLRRDPGDRLDQLADLWAGQGEVAEPTALVGGEQSGVDQLGQVTARGRGRDAGLVGEDARTQ
jgi:hypothetical protein